MRKIGTFTRGEGGGADKPQNIADYQATENAVPT